MVEFILGAFLLVLIRNKFISNINSKAGHELYPVYHFKPLFRSWEIYLPLICMLFSIFILACIRIDNYWVVPYQKSFQTITLLSYIPLIIKYRLYESIHEKLKIKNEIISLITSPVAICTIFIALGSILNTIAIHVNSEVMPIFPSLSITTGFIEKDMIDDGLHTLGRFDSKMIFLTDWIDNGFYIYSPADILIFLFPSIVIYFSIKNSNTLLK